MTLGAPGFSAYTHSSNSVVNEHRSIVRVRAVCVCVCVYVASAAAAGSPCYTRAYIYIYDITASYILLLYSADAMPRADEAQGDGAAAGRAAAAR